MIAKPIERRPTARARGFDSKWDKARANYLLAHPYCVRCAKAGRQEMAVVVDHIKPHRLGAARTPDEIAAARKLFWDKLNWQSLCVTHHSSTKQREEKSGGEWGCTVEGRPLDPNHPWNR